MGKATEAFIDEVKLVGRERFVRVKYHFSIKGKQCYDDAAFNQSEMSFENFKLLTNKTVPLAYKSRFVYTLSFPLIFPVDYKDFGVTFPDSLRWILPLIKKS